MGMLREQERGWYLYGIIRQSQAENLAAAAAIRHDTDDVQLLAYASLAAVVRSVPLADYEPDALRTRLHDASWLEIMARHHHEVILSLHQRRAILPATFGCVYPDEEGLRTALSEMTATLLERLAFVAECDEWTVHLNADSPTLERQLVESHPTLQRKLREIAGATTGRAYLLKRKLTVEINQTIEQEAYALARGHFERLSRHTRASSEQRTADTSGVRDGERELMRALFLVPRAECAPFLEAVEALAAHGNGIRGEASGPWPPYTFAALDTERLNDDQHP